VNDAPPATSAVAAVSHPSAMKKEAWLGLALATTLLWGIWGALIEVPEKAGFPATLGFVAWAATFLVTCPWVLRRTGWRLEHSPRSVVLGILGGLPAGGGNLTLFIALKSGPAWLVFPLVSLYPVLTVLLAAVFLRERVSLRPGIGIALACLAAPLVAWQSPGQPTDHSGPWLFWSVVTCVLWGVQAFVWKLAERDISSEGLYVWLGISSFLIVPPALLLTDFSTAINWGPSGAWLAFIVQGLNSVGALTYVYALKRGRALIVVPLCALAPTITVAISLVMHATWPHPIVLVGVVFSAIAVVLLGLE
jgi:uncharacterized membrane protein